MLSQNVRPLSLTMSSVHSGTDGQADERTLFNGHKSAILNFSDNPKETHRRNLTRDVMSKIETIISNDVPCRQRYIKNLADFECFSAISRPF